MKNFLSLKKIKHIHFVGIVGISMSGLAKLCLNMGKSVSGSDKIKSQITEELAHLGVDVVYKHQKSNIQKANLVVYTCAVGENNIEVNFAREKGVPTLERAEFLGIIAKQYKNVIAIAGSHGKTTVCGMVFKIFETAQKKPTMLVGGEVGKNNNLVIGEKDFLIVEACEYKEHFLKIGHTLGAITNIDYDHPDYFKTRYDYENAFKQFAKQSKECTIFGEKYSIFFEDLKKQQVLTFGNNGNFSARRIQQIEDKLVFDVYKYNNFFMTLSLNVIGKHNIKNALCAIAVADFFNIEAHFIKRGLENFKSIKRRYEFMGKLNDNVVITDYAHHPTQIKNVINATREFYKMPISVIFEPHTYSRTKVLFNDFVDALSLADNVIMLPTYSAREKSLKGGSSKDIFNALKLKKINAIFTNSYKKCYRELEKLSKNVILILGAGSVIKLAEKIKQNYLVKGKYI